MVGLSRSEEMAGATAMLFEIVLMIFFRRIESRCGGDLCNCFIWVDARAVKLLFGFLCSYPLSLIMVEDDRSILSSYIRPLLVRSGGIMHSPEQR